MSTIDWSKYDNDLEILMSALRSKTKDNIGSIKDIYLYLVQKYPNEAWTYSAVRGRIYRLVHSNRLSIKPPSQLPYIAKYWDYINGEKKSVPKVQLPEPHVYKGRAKILYAGDIHFPFEDEMAIEEALLPNVDASLFITSEVMDCYSLTPFYKKENVSLEAEMDKTLRFFEYVSERFPLTIVLAANHDQRITRIIGRRLPASLVFLCETNLVRLLARPFRNVIVKEDWWHQVGDVIYAHAPTYSKVDMKAGFNAYQYFLEWGDTLDINPFSVIVQGHTHFLGTFYRPTKKVIEAGCLCELLPYWKRVGFSSKPWTQGYAVIVQEDGKAILDLCREHIVRGL